MRKVAEVIEGYTYGQPDVARFGGTNISPVEPNPAIGRGCTKFSI